MTLSRAPIRIPGTHTQNPKGIMIYTLAPKRKTCHDLYPKPRNPKYGAHTPSRGGQQAGAGWAKAGLARPSASGQVTQRTKPFQ